MKITSKFVMWALMTVLAEAVLTWLIGKVISKPFVEIVFFIAVIEVGVVYFFSSQSGIILTNVNLDVQASTGIKMEHEERKVFWNPVLVGSLIYLLLAIVLVAIMYREYF